MFRNELIFGIFFLDRNGTKHMSVRQAMQVIEKLLKIQFMFGKYLNKINNL